MARYIVSRLCNNPDDMMGRYLPQVIHESYRDAHVEKCRLEAKNKGVRFMCLSLSNGESVFDRMLSWTNHSETRTARQKYWDECKKKYEEKVKYVRPPTIVWDDYERKVGTYYTNNSVSGRHNGAEAQEKEMATIKVTNPTFVNGVEQSNYSVDQLIDLITKAEKDIATLGTMQAESKAVAKLIAIKQAGVTDLVKVLDAREVK